MYKEINTLIKNDLNNYNKRPLTKSTISYDDLHIIAAYTNMWANDEIRCNRALCLAKDLNHRLYNHIELVTQWRIEISIGDDFIELLNELYEIDEALRYEEECNLGFGKKAKILRRRWRHKLREAHKYLDKRVRNRVLWIKEWSKKHKVYISNLTGECHNGLWWTIRACIDCPQMIKYGFTKEDK